MGRSDFLAVWRKRLEVERDTGPECTQLCLILVYPSSLIKKRGNPSELFFPYIDIAQ